MSAPVDAETDTDTTRRESGVDERDAPTTRSVAETLGVAGDRLRQYVEFHTAPSVANVVAIADRVTLDELDAETRAGIGRWIDDVRATDPALVLEDADDGDTGELWPELDTDGRFEVNHD